MAEKLKCKNCNGTLEITDDKEISFCPYCGTKFLHSESDKVKIAKQKNEAHAKIEMHKQDVSKDIEIAKLNHEFKKRHEETKDTILSLIVGIGMVLAIVLIIFILVNLMV